MMTLHFLPLRSTRSWSGLLATALLLGLGNGGLTTRSATPPLPVSPPPIPSAVLPPSPVQTFRELLAMTADQRATALQARSPAQREVIRSRLAEYEALSPRLREERLQATDLYWHLQHLMRRTAGERGPILATVSPSLRRILDERLTIWDHLPESDRQALLQHDAAIRYFAGPRTGQLPPLPTPSPEPRALAPISLRLQSELARFSQLPADERARIEAQWRQFFDTPSPRTERVLEAMSATEREEMEAVLARFRQLQPEQRQRCIASFARLAQLPPAERSAFLRNVERWNAAAPAERDLWRSLVNKLPILPPLPGEAMLPPLPSAPPQRWLLTNHSSP